MDFRVRVLWLAVLGCGLLQACGDMAPNSNVTIPNQDEARRYRYGSLSGDAGITLLGGGNEDEESPGSTGIGVNSYLWRATLDTIAFMPITSADPFGGVVLTDWYTAPATPGERFKLNVFILDRQLRADAVRVAVFRQVNQRGLWVDAPVDPQTGTALEDTILTRARELRVATAEP